MQKTGKLHGPASAAPGVHHTTGETVKKPRFMCPLVFATAGLGFA